MRASRLQPRKIEQRIHQFQKPQRIAVCDLDKRAALFGGDGARIRQEIFQRAQHQGQGGTKLM
jgi:hypothetical protein